MAFFSAYALIADFDVFVQDGTAVPTSRLVYFFLEQLRGSIEGKGGMFTILALALACLYSRIEVWVSITRYRRFFLTAILLSFCTVIYYPYKIAGTMALMYSTWFQVGKSLAFLTGYSCLIYYGILLLYQYIGKTDHRSNLNRGGGGNRIVKILAY